MSSICHVYRDDLYHFGVIGMKWGIRRYQNKDGSLTALGKKRLSENNIRTEENLVEKTIPKGTKMYRVTPYEKDGNTSKSTYVTWLDVDRDFYKQGTAVNAYTNKKIGDNSVYEHELELKTEVRIPSLKTVRNVEKLVMQNEKHREEAAKSWLEAHNILEGITAKEVETISSIAKRVGDNPDSKAYNNLCTKYGDELGDFYFHEAINFNYAKKYVDTTQSRIVEQSFGRAKGVKDAVIKELQKMGYNAMYDNASIGVGSDGNYNKSQEGIEPLIIFDKKNTLKENGVKLVTSAEQKEASYNYQNWLKNRNDTLKKFKGFY